MIDDFCDKEKLEGFRQRKAMLYDVNFQEALQLTAWPLIRDVFFYSVSLILLVVFFNDNQIFWYEALILFLWYFAYVTFMKFSEKTEDKLRALLKLEPANREEDRGGVELRKSVNRKGLFHLMNETIRPAKIGGNMYELEPILKGKGGITGLKTQLQLDSTGDATTNEAQENGKDDSGKFCNVCILYTDWRSRFVMILGGIREYPLKNCY